MLNSQSNDRLLLTHGHYGQSDDADEIVSYLVKSDDTENVILLERSNIADTTWVFNEFK